MFQFAIYREAMERMNNFRWEAQLGISTRGIVEIDKPDSCHYASVNYSTITRCLAVWTFNPQTLSLISGAAREGFFAAPRAINAGK